MAQATHKDSEAEGRVDILTCTEYCLFQELMRREEGKDPNPAKIEP